MFDTRGLYAITNGPRADLESAVNHALTGGARIVQYRDKTDDRKRRLAEATMLLKLCSNHGVSLIINSDIDLAIECGAAGVHLGSEDIGLTEARVRLGREAIIGVSCYDSIALARRAVDHGASYVGFGAFYPSTTKPNAGRAQLATLIEAESLGVPVVAIGGVTPDNAPPLIAAGADCVAAVSSLFDATDIESTARRFSQLFF